MEPEAFRKKLLQRKARMEGLGITESEMMYFYVSCGRLCKNWDEAFVALKSRFHLNPDDAPFVETALIDNSYVKHKQKYGW
jgi:hypothetical protein